MESFTTGFADTHALADRDRTLDADALVIGAGPAGSATAIRLARAGCTVIVVDRARFPRDKPCSEYLGPGAVRHLEALGVVPELRRRGARVLQGTAVHAAGGSRLTGFFSLADPDFPCQGLSLPRVTLDQVLVEEAARAGAVVLEEHHAVELVSDEHGIAGAIVGDAAHRRRSIRARITIGADGLRSMVARRIGGVSLGSPRRMGFVTHVRGLEGLGHTATMLVSDAGYVGLNPLGTESNVALVVPLARARQARGDADGFFLRELRRFPSPAADILPAMLSHPVYATGPFSSRARRVTADGALLVGDAADFFDPFTGEGIYSALAGAELAAEVLVPALARRGPVRRSDLAAYPRARRRVFLGKWMVERMIGYGMLAPRLFDRAVDRLGRRGTMAHTLVGVTADMLPAGAVLNPGFLARMVV